MFRVVKHTHEQLKSLLTHAARNHPGPLHLHLNWRWMPLCLHCVTCYPSEHVPDCAVQDQQTNTRYCYMNNATCPCQIDRSRTKT